MLTKRQKVEIVNSLAADLKKSRAIVFSDYQGLPTSELQELRSDLRKAGVRHRVVKITLLKRALVQAGVDIEQFNFSVPLAVSMSFDDEVAPAKILHEFSKKNENLKLLAGVMDGQFIDGTQVMQLAQLPSKEELLGQFVSVVAGPLRGLVSVLSGNIRGFINVLNAKSKMQTAK